MGRKILDRYEPAFGAAKDTHTDKAWVMALDSLASTRTIRQRVRSTSEALEAFDGITYTKGLAVLHMLERWVGEDAFQKGIRAYIAKHRWKNATSNDLFRSLREASGQDIDGVASSFVEQSGVPNVSGVVECEPAGTGTKRVGIKLSQRPYRLLGLRASEQAKRWKVPVCAKYDTGAASARACALLDGESVVITLPEASACPRWVFLNAENAGYFRTKYSPAELESLARSSAQLLSEEERSGLVGDAWALVRSGELDIGAYLSALRHFTQEPSRAVWDTILSSLWQIDAAFISDATRSGFQRYVANLIGPSARRLGWEPKPGEPAGARLLRRALLDALGNVAQDDWARRKANELTRRWLIKPESVDADLATVALGLSARSGDSALFDDLLGKMKNAATPEQRVVAVNALAAFDDARLVERLLALSVDGTIRVQDQRYVYPRIVNRPVSRAIAYPWIRSHFSELQERLPAAMIGRVLRVLEKLCDDAAVDDAERLFRPQTERIEGATQALNQSVEAGHLCAALSREQGPKLEAWLRAERLLRTVSAK
jgi:alanyl aminopeptidase